MLIKTKFKLRLWSDAIEGEVILTTEDYLDTTDEGYSEEVLAEKIRNAADIEIISFKKM
ncbi:MAG: hypothetical protein ACK5L6_05200 [Anaerorhabdus sp.]|uniref:hypothetical protein n=1 Tax=Anaerorhabdus sp. TaxID=1872524 RepID=UPI003A8C2FF3